MDIANKYQKKEEKEHILDNPDTYTGSMDKLDIDLYVYDDNSKKFVTRNEIKTESGNLILNGGTF